MSFMNPQSPEQLRALARKSTYGTLSSNEAAELAAAMRQSGPLSRELKEICEGRG